MEYTEEIYFYTQRAWPHADPSSPPDARACPQGLWTARLRTTAGLPPPRLPLLGKTRPRGRSQGASPSATGLAAPGAPAGDPGVPAAERAPLACAPQRLRGAGADPAGGAGPGAHGRPGVRAFPTPGGDPTSRPRALRACVRLSVYSLDVSGNFQPGSERVSERERERSAPESRGRKRRFRHRSGPATR